MDNYQELLKLILPEFLILHFDLVRHAKNGEVMHLYFEKRNNIPKEETNRELIVHGFHKQATIQDFSIRKNTVCLHVKHRRWLDKVTKRSRTDKPEFSSTGNADDHRFRCFFKRN